MISRKSEDKLFPAHFVDSLYISDLAKSYCDQRDVFDIGSGGGFPGLVFAIRYPKITITLFEKVLKKKKFLSLVTERLGLKNVRVNGAFPEKSGKGIYMVRAVFTVDKLFNFMKERVSEGSRFILNLGGKTPGALQQEDFKKLGEYFYRLPLDCGHRKAEIFEFVSRGTK